MNANEPISDVVDAEVESDDARLSRLHETPEDATPADVSWLTGLVRIGHTAMEGLRENLNSMQMSLNLLKDKDVPGRVIGLREASALIRAAADREVTARFLVGKREHAARAMNGKLMHSVSGLIDRYATDVEAGKL